MELFYPAAVVVGPEGIGLDVDLVGYGYEEVVGFAVGGESVEEVGGGEMVGDIEGVGQTVDGGQPEAESEQYGGARGGVLPPGADGGGQVIVADHEICGPERVESAGSEEHIGCHSGEPVGQVVFAQGAEFYQG